ncbi:MAG: tetratricopeptide repeat protein, partial [Proteobacteria bacterium]|nr:tetratricopeptide repeat protein [Pseudomonadota bacterium]
MRAQMRRLAKAFQRAAADHQAGHLGEAERGYQAILAEVPDHADALHGLGLLELQRDRAALAIAYIGQAARARPEDARVHLDLGLALRAQGHFEEARGAIRVATLLDPDDALAHAALGDSLVLLNRLEDAVVAYQAALVLAPELAAARASVGLVLKELGRLDEAVVALRQGLAQLPDHAAAHVALGAALLELDRLDEAEAALRAALALTPDDAMALNNLGLVQHTRGEVTDAVATLSAARRLRPDLAPIASNLAAALRDAGALDAALAECNAALHLDPENADAHLLAGTVHLSRGDFARGWLGFAWRHRIRNALATMSHTPQWDGSSLNGRTLLVWPEQGLGDMIQFCRYIPLIRGGRVIVAAPSPLVRLLRSLPGDAEVVPVQEAVPHAEIGCSVLDLPALFRTELDTIPADVPYLAADPEAVTRWRRRVDRLDGRAIGLCWAGAARYQHDRRRSLLPELLTPLGDVQDVSWVSLQKDPAHLP